MSVLTGVGYEGPDQSHFTSRHFWEVGATSEQLRTGWLGRYLDRAGSPDNPLQGLSLESRSACSGDGANAGRLDRRARPLRLLDAERLGRGRDPDARRARRTRRAPHRGDPALAQATAAARQSARLRQQLLPFRPKKDQPASQARSPIPAARTTTSRAAWPASRRCWARACAPGGRDECARDVRHARQPAAGARGRPQAHRGQPARLPARPRGARARRPRPRSRLVGVRPAREGERVERHRPRGRRRGLPDRRARGGRSASSPGLQASTGTATCAPRRTSAASTARCSSSGSAPTRRRSSRAPEFARPAVLK